jgi:hypothetical protein
MKKEQNVYNNNIIHIFYHYYNTIKIVDNKYKQDKVEIPDIQGAVDNMVEYKAYKAYKEVYKVEVVCIQVVHMVYM